MKITHRQLRKLIKETADEMRSEEAISHAASQREDGMSFKDFAGIIIDRLNLYDEWLDGEDPKDVADWYTRALDPKEEAEEEMRYAAGRPWEHN